MAHSTSATPKVAEYPVSPDVQAMLSLEKPLVTPLRIGAVVVAIAILLYTAQISDLSFGELLQGGGNMTEYISRYFPPDFANAGFPRLRPEQCPRRDIALSLGFTQLCLPTQGYMQDIFETVAMGIWGTLMSAIIAVPLSVVAAENIAPLPVVFIVRRFLDAMRAINEIVFALIFIVAVGLGPFAGVLALFIHTAGTLGKLFSEAIEAIEPGQVEGIRATGASKFQEIVFGVIPQVIPLWTSFTLYRFEANVRSAAVLGIVGAGGIGVSLVQSFRSFKYQNVCAILIFLIVTVAIIDTLSA
ncbi:MAG: phosphonate ABC transporter, permease protein PhnE, partial [Cyanobacteria bacterium J06632_22]